MLCHLDTVLLVPPLSPRPRLLLVCVLLARLMFLLMVHHLQLQQAIGNKQQHISHQNQATIPP